MTTFVLVHGAWHGAWCWDLLRPHLEQKGARAVAVDLPTHDVAAHYTDLVDIVVGAIRDAEDEVVVVGHSFGGLLAPVAAAETQQFVKRIVLLCALIPVPGRSLGDQLSTEQGIFTHQMARNRTERLDGTSTWPEEQAIELFYHDCPSEVAHWAAARGRPHAGTVAVEPCPLAAWPSIATESIVCRDDRVIAPAWSRQASTHRLGAPALMLQGGHSPFLSRPVELADLLQGGGDRIEHQRSDGSMRGFQ